MFKHGAHKPHGHAIQTDDNGNEIVRDTLRCIHCQAHWTVIPGSGRRRGYCFECDGPTCGAEQCVTRCQHWEAKLEAIEKAAAKGGIIIGG